MLLCGNEKENASTNAFLIFCSGTALTEQSAALLSCFRQTQWYPVLLVFLLQRLPHLPHIIIFENGDSSPAARINGFWLTPTYCGTSFGWDDVLREHHYSVVSEMKKPPSFFHTWAAMYYSLFTVQIYNVPDRIPLPFHLALTEH